MYHQSQYSFISLVITLHEVTEAQYKAIPQQSECLHIYIHLYDLLLMSNTWLASDASGEINHKILEVTENREQWCNCGAFCRLR